MVRPIPNDLKTEVTSASLAPVMLIDLEFDSGTLRLWNGVGNLVANSQTYTGAGDILNISTVEETANLRANGVNITLASANQALISVALQENYYNRSARIYMSAMNSSGQVIEPLYELFRGRMDVMAISESADTATIGLACENILVDLQRPSQSLYTPADQNIRFPDDRGLDFVVSIQDAEIEWGR